MLKRKVANLVQTCFSKIPTAAHYIVNVDNALQICEELVSKGHEDMNLSMSTSEYYYHALLNLSLQAQII